MSGCKEYLATIDGKATTAKKVGGRWMVAGDFDTAGCQVILPINGRPAWHTLKGFCAHFSDWATEAEIKAIRAEL